MSVTGLVMAVTVDFSVLGTDSINITAPDSYTLNGITFRYDDFGSGTDTAQLDASGIFGSAYGSLIFDFSTLATSLNFDFSVLGVTQSSDDALFIVFKNGGSDVTDMLVPASYVPYDPSDPTAGGDAFGTLSYSGAAFDQALMVFSPSAPLFSVANVSFEPVPEPSSLILLASGILGLGGLRSFRQKK
jgi:hypothetical protein